VKYINFETSNYLLLCIFEWWTPIKIFLRLQFYESDYWFYVKFFIEKLIWPKQGCSDKQRENCKVHAQGDKQRGTNEGPTICGWWATKGNVRGMSNP